MRAGPIIAGSILLLVGLAAVVAGGMMRPVDDICGTRLPECDADAYMIGLVGEGVFLGGAFAGLAGIGLVVAGVMVDKPARDVPVTDASPPSTRTCPNCGADGKATAKFCDACGAAVGPTMPARA